MNTFYKLFLKRCLDIVGSFMLLLILSPLLVGVSMILLFLNRGKVFFLQPRPGKNEKIFTIIKFRTMTDDVDEYGNLLPDEKRITKLGSFLRKTSIDELPQLINVLKGDMSLVGPRPLLVEYLPLYNEKQKMRHLVKPGLTGYAQINGRNNTTWPERFENDLYYVYNISLFLDLKIIFKTMLMLFFHNEGLNNTIEKFKGNNNINQ
ncbi:MAG: sugar transferase [Cytophagaceae bacterium]|nr:sugar transferase [Cytophagaceae bacterium]MDW8455321.1 sugar transferase [Cytophagaceae bacterium]